MKNALTESQNKLQIQKWCKNKNTNTQKTNAKEKKHCISSKYSSSSPASLLWQLHMYTSHNLNYLCITSLEVFAWSDVSWVAGYIMKQRSDTQIHPSDTQWFNNCGCLQWYLEENVISAMLHHTMRHQSRHQKWINTCS